MWDHLVNDLLNNKNLILEAEGLLINPAKLRNGTSTFFSQPLYKKIPKEVDEDIGGSITNMLIGLWTPSAMLIMRAVEGVLRRFYYKMIGKPPTTSNGNYLNWGNLLQELSQTKMDKDLQNDLKFLNERRNEAQHPDKHFTQEVSESTFMKGIESIRTMLKSI